MAEPPTTTSRRRRGGMKRRLIVAGAVLVAATGTGLGVARAQSSGGAGYRTAVAATDNVRRTLTVSGTVQPVNQAQASFQVAGTVSAVDVTIGQAVTAGQTLATLDTTTVQQQVSQAQANLATAQAKLSADESGQTTSTPSTGTQTTTPSTGTAQTSAAQTTGTTGPTAILTAASVPSATSSLQPAQRAVVTAQHTADLDLQASATKLSDAESVCNASSGSQPGGSTTTTTPTTTPGTSTSTTPGAPTTSGPSPPTTSGGPGGSGSTAACTT
ncbi:MAG: biotin/lipoyl-binding protein, partial [Acidimicrobiales bacterium]